MLSYTLPVKGQIVTRHDFDRIRSLDIAKDIASQVDRGQILDGPIVVTALSRRAVIGRNPDALEGALVYAVNVNTLLHISTSIGIVCS